MRDRSGWTIESEEEGARKHKQRGHRERQGKGVLREDGYIYIDTYI